MSRKDGTQGAPRAAAHLAEVDAAVLAGGLGTRIRSVLGDVPKVLAPIAGRAFLEYLLDWLEGVGCRRVVLGLGFGAARVLEHLAAHPRAGLEVVPVVEPQPLGTAGALRFLRPALRSNPVLVLNGDTFIDVDLASFLEEHLAHQSALSLLCVEMAATDRFGRIELDARGLVQRFAEKSQEQQPGLISGGVYLFSSQMLERLEASTGPSVERDFFERLPRGTLRGIVRRAAFVDIGVPESLKAAEAIVPRAAGRPGQRSATSQGARP